MFREGFHMRHAVIRAFVSTICLAASASPLAAEPAPQRTASPEPPLYHVAIGEAGGVPLVAVNGGPGFNHSYLIGAPVWKAMSERRRIIFYDQQGTGKSPKAPASGDLTVARMVEDLESLRRTL